jgi:hypothetical protein
MKVFYTFLNNFTKNFVNYVFKGVHAISEIDICEIGFSGITICEM